MKESQHGAYGIEFPRPLTEKKKDKNQEKIRENWPKSDKEENFEKKGGNR